jgi:hypothetical protein
MTGEMFGPSDPHSSNSRKRRAEVEPESEHPITKRLARMRIGKKKLYDLRSPVLTFLLDQPHIQPSVTSPEPAQDCSPSNDRMYLDDTKDKVYIHDLESEIAQIEAEEPKGIFLPDIDRKISAIPQQLLQNQGNNANTQMILYHVPSSISVPEAQDHVRKAIIASRARAREKQAQGAEGSRKVTEKDVPYRNLVNGVVPHLMQEEGDDPDAMEIG